MTVRDAHLSAILEGADPSISPCEDLFRAVNGTWLKETEIPADLAAFGSFMELHIQAEKDIHAIVEELAASAPKDGEAKLVADLYSTWMDTEAANAKGATPLRPELQAIEEARGARELAIVTGKQLREGVSTFFAVDVDSDLNDPTRYTTFFAQSGLGLPDEAYYREEQYAEVLAAYRDFVPGMLTLAYGLSDTEAAARAERIIDLETRLAATHMNVVDSRDTDKTNNPMSFADFAATAPDYPWADVLEAAGFTPSALEHVIVLHPDALAASAAIWMAEPAESLQAYQSWRLLRARASYLTEEIDAASFAFYGTVLAGTHVQRERWKRGVSLVNSYLGEAVGKLYAERHFPPSHKAHMEELVADLLEAYRRSITELEWMGSETKQRALAKVDSFALKIGYPDVWRDYSTLTTSDDLVSNIRAGEAYEFDRALGKLGTAVDRTEWFMNPQTVNAYYNPVWNEIVFPAGILQFPFFHPQRDAALNYGGIGAVIGHEIGHGFDDQGSKYDETGALTNWWTDSDRAAFEERTKALIAQYDAYVPAQFGDDTDAHVQGALTIGENIGDLGGLAIGLRAYEIALAREGLTLETAPEIDGYTAVQRLMMSYARIWREKRRTEYMHMLLSVDPHSPAEFRCNGVVKNVDAFAEAFDVREGDALYLPPSERVHIWC